MAKTDKTINDMRELAASKNGEFLSKEFSTLSKYYKWKCEKGHVWETRALHVARGSWCMKCSKPGKKQIHTIEKIKEKAKSQGGECLSDEYTDSRKNLKFKCIKGHVWETRVHEIMKGRWCRKCVAAARNRRASKK